MYRYFIVEQNFMHKKNINVQIICVRGHKKEPEAYYFQLFHPELIYYSVIRFLIFH